MVGQPAAFRRVSVFPELYGPQSNAATIWRSIAETDTLSAQLVLYRQTVEAALLGIEFDPDSAAVENRRAGGKFHIFPHFLQYEPGDQTVSARGKMHIVGTEVARLVVQMFGRCMHVKERQSVFRGDFRQCFAERPDFVRIAKAEYARCSRLALLFAALENSFIVHRHRSQQDDFAFGKRFLDRRDQLPVLRLLDGRSDSGRGKIVARIACSVVVPQHDHDQIRILVFQIPVMGFAVTGSGCGEIAFEARCRPVDQISVHRVIDDFDIVALGFAQKEIHPVGGVCAAVKVPKTVRQHEDFLGAPQLGLLCRLQ